jgi:hypothetical protein
MSEQSEAPTINDTLSLTHDISKLSELGHSSDLSIMYPWGIGSIKMQAEVTDYNTRPSTKVQAEVSTPIFMDLREQTGEAGAYFLFLRCQDDFPDSTDRKKAVHAIGFTVEEQNINTLSQKLSESSSNLTVEDASTAEEKTAKDRHFLITDGERKIDFTLLHRRDSEVPDMYSSPKILMNIDKTKPFEEEVNFCVRTATQVMQLLTGNNQQAFATNPNATKAFVESMQEKVDQLKNKIVFQTGVIEENMDNVNRIFSELTPGYDEHVAQLDGDRQRIGLDSEPDMKTSFPYEKMAEFDFSCEPYLSESMSRSNTTYLSMALADIGVKLDEPVAKLHYIKLIGTNIAGIDKYDLLTSNKLRLQKYGGTDHQQVNSVRKSRIDEGAKYGQWSDLNDFSEDPYGIVVETLSGKKYAIWGAAQASILKISDEITGIQSDKKDFDKEKLEDLEKRYGLTILRGKRSGYLVNQEKLDRETSRAAIDWYQKELKKNPQATEHDLLRAEMLIKSNISPDKN